MNAEREREEREKVNFILSYHAKCIDLYDKFQENDDLQTVTANRGREWNF